LSLFTGKSLLLNVSDDPGSSQITYFTSDFQVRSYQFAVGSNGDAGPVVIDFGGKSDTATGVAQLDTDLTSNHVIPSLTLYVEKTNGGEVTTDQVTFTDAVVSNYADSNHDVTVTFDFQSATLQSVLELPDGNYVSDGTTTIPGDITICYLAGTRILTPTGEVCVETLARGDRVVTRFGGLQRIKWIGRQSYSAAALPAAFGHERREHIPVHLRPGSLGDGLPARDLYVSPGHSMLVDDTLVLAQLLVNGRTITQNECPARIDYYQIELERHDCVIAEGTWSETYADWEEGRRSFHNVAEFHALFPDYHSPKTPTLCAPRPERGAALEAVLRPIVARAAHQVTPGPLNGFIDRVRDDYKLDGWAHDASHPELPVLLEILLEGKVIGTVLACDYRKDLLQAGYGQGRCSFTFISPIKLRTALLATLQVRRAVDGAAVRVSRSIIDAAFEPAIKPRLAIVA
jgi:hypothetical protein